MCVSVCACKAAGPRSAAGRGLGERVSLCKWMRERGVAVAAADPAPRLRTVARGGGGGARANSRSPRRRAAPWLIPERSVIGRRPPLCKRAEGNGIPRAGLTVKARSFPGTLIHRASGRRRDGRPAAGPSQGTTLPGPAPAGTSSRGSWGR